MFFEKFMPFRDPGGRFGFGFGFGLGSSSPNHHSSSGPSGVWYGSRARLPVAGAGCRPFLGWFIRFGTHCGIPIISSPPFLSSYRFYIS